MSPDTCLVVGDGTVTALAGGPISIADMGVRTTKRASRLEFNSDTNEWEVLPPDGGKPLYSHADYDDALGWEIAHFNRLLSLVG
jgi:hypothetical protein